MGSKFHKNYILLWVYAYGYMGHQLYMNASSVLKKIKLYIIMGGSWVISSTNTKMILLGVHAYGSGVTHFM